MILSSRQMITKFCQTNFSKSAKKKFSKNITNKKKIFFPFFFLAHAGKKKEGMDEIRFLFVCFITLVTSAALLFLMGMSMAVTSIVCQLTTCAFDLDSQSIQIIGIVGGVLACCVGYCIFIWYWQVCGRGRPNPMLAEIFAV